MKIQRKKNRRKKKLKCLSTLNSTPFFCSFANHCPKRFLATFFKLRITTFYRPVCLVFVAGTVNDPNTSRSQTNGAPIYNFEIHIYLFYRSHFRRIYSGPRELTRPAHRVKMARLQFHETNGIDNAMFRCFVGFFFIYLILSFIISTI